MPPANCVVIEDAVAGVQAARAAGAVQGALAAGCRAGQGQGGQCVFVPSDAAPCSHSLIAPAAIFAAAGMRVIGVTTTLEPAAMQAVGPDWIQPGIKQVTVADIKGLKLAATAQEQAQPQVLN